MKRTGSGIITFTAFFMAVALHAAIIGGIAYASGYGAKAKDARAAKNVSSARADRYTMLPDVEIISDRSLLKKSDSQAAVEPKKEEFGGSKPADTSGPDDTDKSMFTFEDAVKRKIQEARLYPDYAKREGIQGTAEVVFTLMPDGGVGTVSLVKSSGERTLDEEALSTIKRAAPFPSFPGKPKSDPMNLQVAIVFKLN